MAHIVVLHFAGITVAIVILVMAIVSIVYFQFFEINLLTLFVIDEFLLFLGLRRLLKLLRCHSFSIVVAFFKEDTTLTISLIIINILNLIVVGLPLNYLKLLPLIHSFYNSLFYFFWRVLVGLLWFLRLLLCTKEFIVYIFTSFFLITLDELIQPNFQMAPILLFSLLYLRSVAILRLYGFFCVESVEHITSNNLFLFLNSIGATVVSLLSGCGDLVVGGDGRGLVFGDSDNFFLPFLNFLYLSFTTVNLLIFLATFGGCCLMSQMVGAGPIAGMGQGIFRLLVLLFFARRWA